MTVEIDFKPMLEELDSMKAKALIKLSDAVEERFDNDVMGTWNTKYSVLRTINESDGTAEIYVESKIMGYLNYGTDYKYAVPSSDFVPKTIPGRLKSASGSGHMKYTKKKMRGIPPRRFDDMIADDVSKAIPTILSGIYGI